MAYIPPHKRHSAAGSLGRSPAPSLPPPPSVIRSPHHRPKGTGDRNQLDDPAGAILLTNYGTKLIYADSAICRWWCLSAGPGRVDRAVLRFERFPCESLERWSGGEVHVLVAALPDEGDGGGSRPPTEGDGEMLQPAASIARRILPDLLAAAARARRAAANELVKLSVEARIGKNLFGGNLSNFLESIIRNEICIINGNGICKWFDGYVPNQLLDDTEQLILLKAGFVFESEREDYHVKVFDTCRPDSSIVCKCVVVDGGLQIHKIELNQVRHMMVDVSCLHKDFDFRVTLDTNRISNSLDDGEKDGIHRLISSAIIDSDMKGGLRWPLKKDAMDERFSVARVWHTRYRTFRSSRIRLKLMRSDRFSPKTLFGKVYEEITLKLSGIAEHLRGVDMEADALLEMLQDAIELIWTDLLSFKPSSSSS